MLGCRAFIRGIIWTSLGFLFIAQMPGVSYAQRDLNHDWQEILHDLKNMPEDSHQVERLIDAGYFRKDFKGDSINHYADRAIALSRSLDYQKGLISAYVLKGSFANSHNQFDSAIEYYRKALSINRSQNNPGREAQIKDNLANVFMKLGSYDSSLLLKFEALNIFHDLEDSLSLGIGYAGIGSVFLHKKDYPKAVRYSLEALRYDTSPQRALTLGNIGAAKKNLGEIDSAIYYYRWAADLLPQYPSFVGHNYNNVGLLFLQEKQIDSARWYLEESRARFSSIKDTFALARNNVSLSFIDLEIQEFDLGIEKCRRAEKIIQSHGSLQDRVRLYNVMSQLYAGKKQFASAWESNMKYQTLHDSITDLELQSRVAEIEIKYASSEKEKKILSQELELERRSSQSQRLQGGILALLILAFSITYFLIQRGRINKFKAAQLANAQQRKIEDLEYKNQLMAMNAMVKGQEEERNRIAKDLHDGLGGLLSTVKIHFQSVQNELQLLREHKNYHKATVLLDQACDEVRRIAHNMMPDVLSQFGLPATVEDLAESLEKKGLQVHTELINMEDRLSEELEINIYRIIQELINNVLKYAEAKKVIIQLSRQAEEIHITVEDDGRGFNPAEKFDGIGLKNIFSRVAFLSGEVDVQSKHLEGTSVSINIPLHPHPAEV